MLSPRHYAHAVAIVALCTAVVCVYKPSLRHGPRSDHWGFVFATMHEESFVDLVARTYSYNRQGDSPGDYPLFRPLLFVLLSAETALFGHDYTLWQATGIFFHLLAVLLLLRLLLRVRQQYAPTNMLLLVTAYSFTAFFALNFAIVEMVIWSHINGYLLQIILTLSALLLLLDPILKPRAEGYSKLRFSLAYVLLLSAAFTHEMGQFFAVLVGIVLAVSEARKMQYRRAWILFFCYSSVLLIYQTANQLDQRAHPGAWVDINERSILDSITLAGTIQHALRYVLFTLFQPFFPSLIDWGFQGRVCLWEPVYSSERYFNLGVISIISYLVFIALLHLSLRSLFALWLDERGRVALLYAILPVGLIGLHLTMTVLGRMNVRPGPNILAHNPYYSYLPLLLFFVFVYLLLAASMMKGKFWATRRLALTCAGLCVLTICSASVVLDVNRYIRHAMYPMQSKLRALVKCVRNNGHDPNFKLSFSPQYLDAIYASHNDAPVALALYRKWIDHEHPTHVLALDNGKASLQTIESYRQSYPNSPTTILPQLERAHQLENIYSHHGRYYLVFGWNGYYRADRKDYAYLLQGDSVDHVLQQLPELHHQMAEDRRTGKLVPPGVPIQPLHWREYGMELYQAGSRYYAIPANEGPLTQLGLLHDHYSQWFVADTLPQLFSQFRSKADTASRRTP